MTTTDPTTLAAFIAAMDATGTPYTRDGLTFTVEGYLNLNSVTHIPDGTVFNVGDSLYLRSVTHIPDGTVFNVGGYLDLNSVTSIPDGTVFNVGGSLNLNSVTHIPDGTVFNVGGYLDLRSVTSIPDGTVFNVKGYLHLDGLTSETQRYAGKTIRIRTIDNICTRLISKRQVGTITLWSAQYFTGNLDTDKRCYVAHEGEDYAHGDTAEKALADLRFKVLSRTLDPDELIATIKARGTVELIDYRLLTGACDDGARQHLISHGIDPDTTESLPLAKALEISRSGYGGQRFAQMMEKAA